MGWARRGDFLVYPVSFDVGPDRRIYVLDAGSSRVIVFSKVGNYITHWGEWGNGEGQFYCGTGMAGLYRGRDLTGSIAVDGDGNVYVSDGTTGRIQKFAP